MRYSALAIITTASFLLPALAAPTPTPTPLKSTASKIAHELRSKAPSSILYPITNYWWWESAIVTDAFLTYGLLTGDTQYEEAARDTLTSQAGPANDFMNPELATGNDDQAWWALAALTAGKKTPAFVSATQNVFAAQKKRWQGATCGGGLKWGIVEGGHGWNYRSTITQGLFALLSAELEKGTPDADVSSWAARAYDWAVASGLIDAEFNVLDGLGDQKTGGRMGCEAPVTARWSYNAGIFLQAAAVIAASTGNKTWVDHTDGLLTAAIRNFVQNGQLYEPNCQSRGSCNADQQSFRGILARCLGSTAVLMPGLKDEIVGVLDSAARAEQKAWKVGLSAMQDYVALETINAAMKVGLS